MENQGKLDFGAAEQEALEKQMTKNKLTPETTRLAYYALLASAMMYKEMFFRDDIQIVNEAPTPDASEVRTKYARQVKNKTIRNKHEADKLVYKKKVEYMNKRMYEEIESIVNKMSAPAKIAFEKTSEYITACTEELLYARDQSEVLGLLKMYNSGQLDILFENSRKQAIEQAIKNEETVSSPEQ